jgi:hypothetical protein
MLYSLELLNLCYLVTLGPDIDDGAVDQGSTVLKALANHAQDNFEPKK